MAETTPVAEPVTLPSTEEIERASAFTREPFLTEGEDAASALAHGTPRRRALDSALEELSAGAKVPSPHWRRQWSLLLGLDRLLSQEEPHLVDGTVLSAHQVDALSGTLTALLADRLKNGDGPPLPPAAEPVLDAGEEDDEDEDDDEAPDWDAAPDEAEAEDVKEAPEDPNADKRFWFEHATGAGKTVAALGFVEASRTGGVLILTHRRNLVDQFHGELRDRGYKKRIAPALLGHEDTASGPVTVETYQWFVRNAGNVSDAYSIVICDEAHTALGEKTSAAIRAWTGPVFVGMTATGALIARHVTDLFPTQTSRFDLGQAARRGVISPLRCVRIPPGPGVRTIAKVPLRRGEVDTEFDQELLAELLDQLPFNLAVADLYKTRFNGVPGVVYSAGVRHAYNVAQAFRDLGMKAQAVSGETPKRELAQILARYEAGDIDVLVNAQLLAEGWNSPRATVCMHLAPTASKRIYQQRVGRVTRRHLGKEAGIVVDFVHPATKHDDPVVTLHSLLDRDVYRGGAIVVGPVRRGRGRRLRVERRVLPVTSEENRRIEVFERELWRIAVEHLDYGEQVQWAALAGARVAPTGWRRARAMLHFDQGGELKRTFLITAVDRNKNPALRLRALQEIASGRDAEAFDRALDFVESWPRDDKREGVKVVLQALAEKKIGRRDQANNWIWRCANMTREVHEEYAVQRWPETKRLLGLLVNSSGGAHARNARRLVHSARQQDRRLSAALLAAAIPHTAEAGEVINGARTRMSRKPAALARELLRNFPKGRGKAKRRRTRRKGAGEGLAPDAVMAGAANAEALEAGADDLDLDLDEEAAPSRRRSRRRRPVDADPEAAPRRGRSRTRRPAEGEPEATEGGAPKRRPRRVSADAESEATEGGAPKRRPRRVSADAELRGDRGRRAEAPAAPRRPSTANLLPPTPRPTRRQGGGTKRRPRRSRQPSRSPSRPPRRSAGAASPRPRRLWTRPASGWSKSRRVAGRASPRQRAERAGCRGRRGHVAAPRAARRDHGRSHRRRGRLRRRVPAARRRSPRAGASATTDQAIAAEAAAPKRRAAAERAGAPSAARPRRSAPRARRASAWRRPPRPRRPSRARRAPQRRSPRPRPPRRRPPLRRRVPGRAPAAKPAATAKRRAGAAATTAEAEAAAPKARARKPAAKPSAAEPASRPPTARSRTPPPPSRPPSPVPSPGRASPRPRRPPSRRPSVARSRRRATTPRSRPRANGCARPSKTPPPDGTARQGRGRHGWCVRDRARAGVALRRRGRARCRRGRPRRRGRRAGRGGHRGHRRRLRRREPGPCRRADRRRRARVRARRPVLRQRGRRRRP